MYTRARDSSATDNRSNPSRDRFNTLVIFSLPPPPPSLYLSKLATARGTSWLPTVNISAIPEIYRRPVERAATLRFFTRIGPIDRRYIFFGRFTARESATAQHRSARTRDSDRALVKFNSDFTARSCLYLSIPPFLSPSSAKKPGNNAGRRSSPVPRPLPRHRKPRREVEGGRTPRNIIIQSARGVAPRGRRAAGRRTAARARWWRGSRSAPLRTKIVRNFDTGRPANNSGIRVTDRRRVRARALFRLSGKNFSAAVVTCATVDSIVSPDCGVSPTTARNSRYNTSGNIDL